MRISDWSSDVCSSDLQPRGGPRCGPVGLCRRRHWPKRSLSAIIANAARAASPPLSFSDLRARTHAWASFSTVKIPLPTRSEEHTSELQSLMRISYAVFCLKKKKHTKYSTLKNNKDE